MDKEIKPMTTKELTQAVRLLLERDENRVKKERSTQRQEIRHHRESVQANVEELTKAVTVMKWCVVSITGIMTLSIIILIMVVSSVHSEVEEIKREAELIRDKIRHPLESIGGAMGRGLDGKIKEAIGGE